MNTDLKSLPSPGDKDGASALVAALVRPVPAHEVAGSLAAELTPAGWSYFTQKVLEHGLAGMVLERASALSLPGEVFSSLKDAKGKALKHGLWLQCETRRAVEILTAAGCEKIAPIKGAYLLPCLYEQVGIRSINDADLLIPKADQQRAHEAFVEAGYTYKAMPMDRPATQREGYERTYLSPEGVPFDVHTALCQPERVALDYEAMWSRTRVDSRLTPWGEGLTALDAVDTLLVLSLHPAQDSYQGVYRQFVDFSWWLHFANPDLEEATERAIQAGAGTALWVALWLARRSLGVFVESEILKGLQPGFFRRRYLQYLLGRRPLTPLELRRKPRLAQALTLFPVMDGGRRRGRFLWRYLQLRGKDVLERQRL